MVETVRDCNFFTDSTPNKPESCAATRGTVGWGACCSYFLVRKDIAFFWVHIALYFYIKWLHSAEFTVKTQSGNVGKVKIVKASWGKVGTQTNSLQRNCNNTWQWWTPAHSPCGMMTHTSPLFVLTTKTYLLIFFKNYTIWLQLKLIYKTLFFSALLPALCSSAESLMHIIMP